MEMKSTQKKAEVAANVAIGRLRKYPRCDAPCHPNRPSVAAAVGLVGP